MKRCYLVASSYQYTVNSKSQIQQNIAVVDLSDRLARMTIQPPIKVEKGEYIDPPNGTLLLRLQYFKYYDRVYKS